MAKDTFGFAFVYDEDSTQRDDGVFCFIPNSNPVNGRYLREWIGDIDTRFAGFSGDSSDCRAGITKLATAIGFFIPGGKADVYFPAGQYNFDEDYTIPANITCKFDSGVRLSTATGKLLTIPVSFTKDQTSLFIGAGSVSITGVDKVFPEWFGADSGVDNFLPIQKTFASTTLLVWFPSKTGYPCASDPSIPALVNVYAESPIYLTDHPEIEYLATGWKLNNVNSRLAAWLLRSFGNLQVDGNANIDGDINIGGAINQGGWVFYSPVITPFGGGSLGIISSEFSYNKSVGKSVIVSYAILGVISGTVTEITVESPAPTPSISGFGICVANFNTGEIASVTAAYSSFFRITRTPPGAMTAAAFLLSGQTIFTIP